jgi:hypothetical protein
MPLGDWTVDNWLELGGLILTALGMATTAIFFIVKWFRGRKTVLKSELSVHHLCEPKTGTVVATGIKVRVVHRRGPPIKIKKVIMRLKGVDLTEFFAKGFSSGFGANPMSNVPEDQRSLGITLYRLKENLLVQPQNDPEIDFGERHDEYYFTAIPILTKTSSVPPIPYTDVLNQYFLNSKSEKIEIVASGPDGEIVLKHGYEVQCFIKSLTDHFPGPLMNVGFPVMLALTSVSATPPMPTKLNTFNDKSIIIPPPPTPPS